MKKELKRKKLNMDLTKGQKGCKAVGPQLLPILQNIEKYNIEELKRKLIDIIDDPETYVSKMKSYEYKDHISRIYNIHYMREYIKNLYLASANLSTKLK